MLTWGLMHSAKPAKPAKQLDEEGRKTAAKSMLDEFVASNDSAEALTCMQEISGPGVCRSADSCGFGLA